MNKIIKGLLIFLNMIALYLSYKWYESDSKNHEPLIVLILQASTILGLFFEEKIGNFIINKNVNKGNINAGRDVHIGDREQK